MEIKLMFAWYDFWIGWYWNRLAQTLYIFPVPMIGIRIYFRDRFFRKLNRGEGNE